MAAVIIRFDSPEEEASFADQPRAQELIDAQVTAMLGGYAQVHQYAVVRAAVASKDVNVKSAVVFLKSALVDAGEIALTEDAVPSGVGSPMVIR